MVFARRADGTFLARQLVAITEDDRLLFFPVYPRSAPDALQDVFYDYDLCLAGALGLPAWRGGSDEGYVVAQVLGREFYDDGPWARFVIEDGPATLLS